MNNYELGRLYEIYVLNYIRQTNDAYMWNYVPLDILIKYGIVGSHNEHRIKIKERLEDKNYIRDTGVDIIMIENDDKCALVQCKNGYKSGLKMKDLTGFALWLLNLPKLNGYVYYTSKLSKNLIELPNINRLKYIKLEMKQEETKTKEYKAYDYQIEAKKEFIKHFGKNNSDTQTDMRGILSMPCGTGKTFTSFLISKKFKQIVIISPLIEFAKQNVEKYIEYGYSKENTLICDSDGERDIKEIKKFIKNNNKLLISCTYDSIDVVGKCLNLMDDLLIIIDEFHNLSKNNIFDKDNYFYKVLHSNYTIMFMSATPRIYELEDDDYDNEEIFGNIIYNISFNEAIEKKYITDYKVWLPSISEDNTKLNNELNIYDIDKILKSKCTFLFISLVKNGSKKCIIYCKNINEINEMISSMKKLNKFFYLDYESSQITCNNTKKQRKEILNNFSNSDKIQLLFSVRILDECIDIPSCDSIYISYPCKNKIRIIQRLSRAIRIDPNNKFKIANIFIWCDEYDKILNTLSSIKEYDLFFKDKIKIVETNFYGDSDKKNIEKDIELISKFIIGIKEFKILSWDEKLKKVEKYIEKNGKRPSSHNENNKIKQLGNWIGDNNKRFTNENYIKSHKIEYNKWIEFIDKYKKYFMNKTEKWLNNLDELIIFVDTNLRIPTSKENYKLTRWITQQLIYYPNKDKQMQDEYIYNTWTEFIDMYGYIFEEISKVDKWYKTFKDVKNYIDTHDKKPNHSSSDIDIKYYSKWIQHQLKNYKNEQQIMSNKYIRIIWNNFVTSDKYKKYFKSKFDIWYDKFLTMVEYIDKNNEIPLYNSWIYEQKKLYKNNEMTLKRKIIWKKIITSNKYKNFFISEFEIWYDKFKLLKTYINTYDKTPSQLIKSKKYKNLGTWLNTQKQNYKNNKRNMKNDENIKRIWEKFITSDKYKKYFISEFKIWKNNLILLKEYIDKNDKTPSKIDTCEKNQTLGIWLTTQKQNYKNNKNNMKTDNNIKYMWEEFITSDKYKIYFMSEFEIWKNKLKLLKQYINKYDKLPSKVDKNDDYKTLGFWVKRQKHNYTYNKTNMKNNENIKKTWEKFITSNKYKHLF